MASLPAQASSAASNTLRFPRTAKAVGNVGQASEVGYVALRLLGLHIQGSGNDGRGSGGVAHALSAARRGGGAVGAALEACGWWQDSGRNASDQGSRWQEGASVAAAWLAGQCRSVLTGCCS